METSKRCVKLVSLIFIISIIIIIINIIIIILITHLSKRQAIAWPSKLTVDFYLISMYSTDTVINNNNHISYNSY